MLREQCDLGVPHVERGALRIRQRERGGAFRALHFDVDRQPSALTMGMVPPSRYSQASPLSVEERRAKTARGGMMKALSPSAADALYRGRAENDGEGRWR